MTGAEQKRGAQTEKPRPEIARRQCHDHAQPAGAAGGNGEPRRVGVQADARQAAPGQHRGQAVRRFVGQRHHVARARPRHWGEHQHRRNHGETQNDRRRRRRLAGERSPPHFSHDDLHEGRSSTARRGREGPRGARSARMPSSSCGGAPCVEVVVREVWRRALAGQPAPPPPVVLGLAVVAAVLVLAPVAWPRTRHVVTLAHEGAHGLAAVLTGRRLAGIRLHSDTSGLTVSSGRPRGLGMVVTLAAGYLGPGLFGLGAAFLLGAGHAIDVLWLVLVLLVLLLVQIRNWFGFCSVLVTGTVLLAASWWLPDRGQSVLAYLVTWL